ncbi:MAG: outer rane lipoprotein carrier protein LolA [Alphaproteobacteria bacterium]|nr:outer rane lipoprotein carrier protein LolA [Alphaproteobacteria bacterium]
MRAVVKLAVAVFAVIGLTAAGQQAPQRMYQSYTDQEKADLDKVSATLNTIRTLRSQFVQIGPDGGTDQGVLYIEKPGRIRFEYRPPSPVLIVANGGAIYVKNARLNTVDKYDLSDTPLGLLLNDRVDLAHNKAVLGVQERDGAVIVQARTSANRNNSNITLIFSAPGLELRQWTVKDNQGGITTVALQSPQIGAALDEALFTPPTRAIRQSGK